MIEIQTHTLVFMRGLSDNWARLSLQFEVRSPLSYGRNGVSEWPSPNHKGWRTGSGSHGDDMGSDGASLAGTQPYAGDKRELLRCVTGFLRVWVGTKEH